MKADETFYFIAGDSYLAQLAQYLGMVLVGLIIPVLLKNKQKGYSRVNQEDHLDQTNDMNMVKKKKCINVKLYEKWQCF